MEPKKLKRKEFRGKNMNKTKINILETRLIKAALYPSQILHAHSKIQRYFLMLAMLNTKSTICNLSSN